MGDVLLEVVMRFICYPVGWVVLKLVTLGRYPAKGGLFSAAAAAEWTSAVGLAVWVLGAAAVIGVLVG